MFGRFFTTALEIRADGTYTPFSADAWSYAGQMTFLGMLMVFSVLAILWGVLMLFKVIFAGKEPKKVKTVPQQSTPATAVQKVAEPTVAVQNSDSELVAIITAAVAAYMADSGEQVPVGGFRVVSFTRVKGGKPWTSK